MVSVEQSKDDFVCFLTSLTNIPPVECATKTIGLAPRPSAARVPASSTSSSSAWANMSPCWRSGFRSVTSV